ncbi:MAG TPA: chemotaxis protein CheB [Lacunisphaera sp.]|jgi:two-component system CheB/CheR fusion protein
MQSQRKRPRKKKPNPVIVTAKQPDRSAESVDREQPPRLSFTVVGIGASAGGLEALTEFFKIMPADRGIAFVVVQHLAPDRQSVLAEIIAKHTAMPVVQIEDGAKVEPNRVYVIAPGRTLTIYRGTLRLGEPINESSRRRPVDDFFRSLADEQRERAVCVIMSGMGSNGTAGAQTIKAVGGLCIAQDPESAKFPAMPRALIDAGLADFVLPVREIPDVISRYISHPYAQGVRFVEAEQGRERKALEEILTLIKNRVRHDFTVYRKPTVIRRIQRRMGLNQLATMAEYVRLLRQAPPEVHVLADDLLIHVTGFFRDPEVWETLRKKVINPLVADRPDGGMIRAWVSACSTGEEAFSLAILLVEAAKAVDKHFDIKIFATDTAERALNHARASLFPGGIESEVSPERLRRFFDPEENSYRIKKELRELVVFAPQNILQDPPFSRLDICTCRNLFIYLEPAIQRRALDLLHFSLREGGILLLGNSENISGADDLFDPVDRKHRIFRRVGPTRHGKVAFPMPATAADTNSEERQHEILSRPSVAQLTRKTLLEEFTPPGIVIDQNQKVVYFHGNTERYLDQPKGEATYDLMAVMKRPLRAFVRNAVLQAMAQKQARTVRERVPLSPKSSVELEVDVTPLPQESKSHHYLVTFVEHHPKIASIPAGRKGVITRQRLVKELEETRSELQSTIDELEASNEEMKAAHEETISVNEELQSTNEELETSKEELQSLNEELTTVNSQLQVKMEELESSSNDMASLLQSTDIAVVFLDLNLFIRRYTPAVRDLFEIIPTDVGRPLSHLAMQFSDPELFGDIRSVLDSSAPRESEVASNSGKTFMRRVLPYRKNADAVEGLVLTFVDISARKSAELELRASAMRHNLILAGIKEYGIFMLDCEGCFTVWTAGAERILGYTEDEVRGKSLDLLHTPEDRATGRANQDLARAEVDGSVSIERWHVRKDGSRFWATGTISVLHDENGKTYGFVKVVRDNTDHKRAEDSLRDAMMNAEAANASKDHFLANVSHELRTPLSATMLWAKLLSDEKHPNAALLKEGLSAINRSVKEQQVLIEDLMDTAKIVAGKMRLEPQYFDLNGMIGNLLPPLRTVATEKQIVILDQLDPEVGTVEADPRRLQQVIANLINNAIKFTPAGGQIVVSTGRSDEAVEIKVTDNGKGIGPEFLSRIFDRFVQIDQGSTPTASGMGLGLAIARQLVDLHHGTIRAESAGPGTGTTFVILLPLPREKAADLTPMIDDVPRITLTGRRILLAEDSMETRDALASVLETAGAEVAAVGTVSEALESFDATPPDLILSDIGLGNNTGHVLIAEIRRREIHRNLAPTPALALTAYADEKNRRKAFESGFQDCLTKPIEPQVLLAKLANLDVKRQG